MHHESPGPAAGEKGRVNVVGWQQLSNALPNKGGGRNDSGEGVSPKPDNTIAGALEEIGFWALNQHSPF